MTERPSSHYRFVPPTPSDRSEHISDAQQEANARNRNQSNVDQTPAFTFERGFAETGREEEEAGEPEDQAYVGGAGGPLAGMLPPSMAAINPKDLTNEELEYVIQTGKVPPKYLPLSLPEKPQGTSVADQL